MKRFLDARSKRFGYDGWGLFPPGSTEPLTWSVSTTREEVRELVADKLDLFKGYTIDKVVVTVKGLPEPSTARSAAV